MRILTVLCLLLGLNMGAVGAAWPQADPTVTVDDSGVLRQQPGGEELALFGVNYGVPFAYPYRALQRIGIDHKHAMDVDLSHFSRLGLDAYRIHVWDRQISDRAGNLVDNDHLENLDYLLAALHKRNIRVVLTPIAWWPSGWPEPDPVEAGFSQDYSRQELANERDTWPIQARYITQFLNHVNRYTGIAYKDDPNIVAIELINEPKHGGKNDTVTEYIDFLVAAARKQGLTRPIVYNISEQGVDREFARAVCTANIQAVSYQWYPTGLVRLQELTGNMLPTVDRYPQPFDDVRACRDKAKLVYEFDAADVAGSYMYPAMARSFRTAGFQWATQFAYDPAYTAYSNAEYNTHYLNLLYTPGKAISLMIAGQAFRSVPRGKSFGAYPQSARFNGIEVSWEEDLSRFAGPAHFYYSNTTTSAAHTAATLEHIAGVGSSPLVQYDGAGAYFLDKLGDGTWRLDVFPDAIPLQDPFQSASAGREVTRLCHMSRTMSVRLEDLGPDFAVIPANPENTFRPPTNASTFSIRPGSYLLVRDHGQANEPAYSPDFVLPDIPPAETLAVNDHTPERVRQSRGVLFSADILEGCEPREASVLVRRLGDRNFIRIPMNQESLFKKEAELSAGAAVMQPGILEYAFVIETPQGPVTYPGGTAGSPLDWDFVQEVPYRTVRITRDDAAVTLLHPESDIKRLVYPQGANSAYSLVVSEDDEIVLQASLDPANQAASRTLFIAPLAHGYPEWVTPPIPHDALHVRLRASNGDEQVVIALVDTEGQTWAAQLSAGATWESLTIGLDSFQPAATPLPKAYPLFSNTVFANPDHLDGKRSEPLHAGKLDAVMVQFAPAPAGDRANASIRRIEIAEITLVRSNHPGE